MTKERKWTCCTQFAYNLPCCCDGEKKIQVLTLSHYFHKCDKKPPRCTALISEYFSHMDWEKEKGASWGIVQVSHSLCASHLLLKNCYNSYTKPRLAEGNCKVAGWENPLLHSFSLTSSKQEDEQENGAPPADTCLLDTQKKEHEISSFLLAPWFLLSPSLLITRCPSPALCRTTRQVQGVLFVVRTRSLLGSRSNTGPTSGCWRHVECACAAPSASRPP